MLNHTLKSHDTNYVDQGHGSPVILVHGVGASLNDWDCLMPELAAAGFRACALDLLGHGDSLKPDEPLAMTVESIYEHLRRWIAGLELAEPLALVGHSLGGTLGLMLALREPRQLRGLVLVNPVVCPYQLSPVLRWLRRRPEVGVRAMRRVPDQLIETVMGWEPSEGAHFSAPRRRVKAQDYKRASPLIAQIPSSIEDLRPRLPQVTCRTLILWGEMDRALNPAFFPDMLKAMPNAVGHAMRGCGHQPHIAQPEAFNRLVLGFLRGL